MKLAESVKSIISEANSASKQNSHPSSKVIDGICIDTRIISELEKWRYYKFTKTEQASKFIVLLNQLKITGKKMELIDDKIHFGGKVIQLVPRWRDYAPHIKIFDNSTVTDYYVTQEENQLMLKIETITRTNGNSELTFQFPCSENCHVSLIKLYSEEDNVKWYLRIHTNIQIFTPEIMDAFEETLFNIDSLKNIKPADIFHKHSELLKNCSIQLSRFNTVQWNVSITDGKCTAFSEYDSTGNICWEIFSKDFSDPKETLRYEYMKTSSNKEHRHIEEEMQFLYNSFKFQTNAADPVKRLMECMEDLKKQVEKAKNMI